MSVHMVQAKIKAASVTGVTEGMVLRYWTSCGRSRSRSPTACSAASPRPRTWSRRRCCACVTTLCTPKLSGGSVQPSGAADA
jgi:hypothetical protein